ncbi:hypothetical protein SAMN05445756_1972 [Kytococcus aerolatus]|uniref:Uncharacterized protein n=1 Tax=Kytococcus aerolatus TaxID=592308 RepID=A0A212U5B8_9MICO|nr:hypothetical protein [Kytococcus aerolatus]SNC73452.1 hypothetical protein SAMN05445756_1972 [Kytococcus aerolatus]
MPRSDLRRLVAPAVGAGLSMALYLGLRPYGDQSDDPVQVAEAFASVAWVGSHLGGMAALASVGRLALRTADLLPGALARAGRWSGLAGAVLVMPYYGAETFSLHVIGRQAAAGALSPEEVVVLAEQIRSEPVAMSLFGAGLVLLAVAGVLVGAAWHRSLAGPRRWAAWPLAVMVALVLPQYYLPGPLRVVFGVVFALAALGLAATALGAGRRAHPLR